MLGITAPGAMGPDLTLPLKGKVAKVLFEELRPEANPGGPAGSVIQSKETTYDGEGRPTEEIQDYGAKTVTVIRYDGDKLMSREATIPAKKDGPKYWDYFTYNSSGKLGEYKRGQGDEIQNHELNFKRDAEGRLLGYEYRQGATDSLFRTTQFSYSADGATYSKTETDSSGDTLSITTYSLDKNGDVVRVVLQQRNWKTKTLEKPITVNLRHDARRRLVEQITVDPEFEPAGSENSLPPGTVTIAYDDDKHTKTTTYSGKLGAISSTVVHAVDGTPVSQSITTAGRSLSTKLDYKYDSQGNWTACQLLATNSGVTKVTKVWRQTITYR
ncbi:MAG: hypothetical protein ABL967_18720 [Bryobacteraceae bacterium]